MSKLVFEYTDDGGGMTHVEKNFSEWGDTQLHTLMMEIEHCLLACGFQRGSIEDYWNTDEREFAKANFESEVE